MLSFHRPDVRVQESCMELLRHSYFKIMRSNNFISKWPQITLCAFMSVCRPYHNFTRDGWQEGWSAAEVTACDF